MVLALSTLALVACDKDTFTNPDMPAAGEVTSNGGVSVAYGNYVYFVNGYQSAPTSVNGYTGAPKTGDIVRMTIDEIEEVYAVSNDNEIASADKAEAITDAVIERAEVVVPYFFYSGVTEANSNIGLYIFGGKLYFTTPNPELTSGGNSQASQLSIYSCELDGTKLTKLFSIESNAVEVALVEVNNAVYAMYTNTDLFAVKLGDKEATTVAEAVTGTKFDGDTAYFINEDGALACYTAGATEATTVLANDDKDTLKYTITTINDGTIYFTMSENEPGLLAIKAGDDNYTTIYDSTVDGTGTAYNMLPYGDQVVMVSAIAATDGVQMYLTNNDNTEFNYILLKNSNSSAITLNSIKGSVLSFTIDSVVYELDLADEDYLAGGTYTYNITKADLKGLAQSATISTTGWAAADLVELNGTKYYFYFTSSYATEVAKYVEEDGKWMNETVNITLYDTTEEDK